MIDVADLTPYNLTPSTSPLTETDVSQIVAAQLARFQTSMRIYGGTNTMVVADSEGVRVGGPDVSDAPFSVDMDGVMTSTKIRTNPVVGMGQFNATDVAASPSNFAFTGNGRYAICFQTTELDVYDATESLRWAFKRAETFSRTGLSITPRVLTYAKDSVSGTEYVIAFAAGGTAGYRYDADGQNETALSISGTTLTGIHRAGVNFAQGYIYLQDGATGASTSVKRFTFSGSTLTYVDTITLSAAPTASAALNFIWVGNTNMALTESYTNSSSVTFTRYNRETGTATSNFTWGHGSTGVNAIGLATRSSDGDLLFLQESSADTNCDTNIIDIGYIMDN